MLRTEDRGEGGCWGKHIYKRSRETEHERGLGESREKAFGTSSGLVRRLNSSFTESLTAKFIQSTLKMSKNGNSRNSRFVDKGCPTSEARSKFSICLMMNAQSIRPKFDEFVCYCFSRKA